MRRYLFNKWKALLSQSFPSLRWLLGMRIKHFWLTLTTSFGSALISGFITILITFSVKMLFESKNFSNIYDLIGISPPNKDQAFGTLEIIIGFSFFLLIFTYLNYLLFKKSPPETYARVSIGGASVSTAFRISAYEAWKVCLGFSTKCGNTKLYNLAALIVPDQKEKEVDGNEMPHHNLTSKDKKLVKKNLDRLIKLEKFQDRKLQNIYEIKKLVSSQFSLPQRRLCDYILQFSPSIYKELMRKYISNWEEIWLIETEQIGTDSASKRKYQLARSIKRIYKGIEELIGFQEQLMRFTDLHRYVYSMSYDLSTSSSLRSYVEALSKVARDNDEVDEKLRFLYIKRNAHSGFDLHNACVHYCELYGQSNNANFDQIRAVLKGIKKSFREEGNFQINGQQKSSLRLFSIMFHNSLVEARKKITEKFVDQYPKIVNHASPENTLLVIQGYSKTVRQMIKKGLKRIQQDRQSKGKKFSPRIFLLKSEKEGSDMLNTRLMKYELRSDDIFSSHKHFMMAGDINFLLSIIRPGLQVIIFLGAECFDMQNEEVIRSMHVNGISDVLPQLKNEIKLRTKGIDYPEGVECKVILAAEKYKRYENLLLENEFYKDHLEEIDVYTPGMIDMAITD